MALLRQWLASHEAEISARKLAAPAGKGGSVWDVGYGTKQEYLEAIEACRAAGMQVYADVVFNHK
jgi:alpha-amylase